MTVKKTKKLTHGLSFPSRKKNSKCKLSLKLLKFSNDFYMKDNLTMTHDLNSDSINCTENCRDMTTAY